MHGAQGSVLVVLVTAPSGKIANALARGLVSARLAACVNVIGGVKSHYRWKGRLHADKEALLIIKTRKTNFAKMSKFIRENHPSQVPEIIGLPVDGGSAPYLKWVLENTR